MLSECGISYEGDVLDLALDDKLIARSGSWFSYGEVRIGQGRERAREFLQQNPDVLEELKVKILQSRGIGKKPTADEPEAATEPAAATEPEAVTETSS